MKVMGPLEKLQYTNMTHAQITKIHTQKMTGRTKSLVCPVNLGCVGNKMSHLIDQPTHNSTYNSNTHIISHNSLFPKAANKSTNMDGMISINQLEKNVSNQHEFVEQKKQHFWSVVKTT